MSVFYMQFKLYKTHQITYPSNNFIVAIHIHTIYSFIGIVSQQVHLNASKIIITLDLFRGLIAFFRIA